MLAQVPWSPIAAPQGSPLRLNEIDGPTRARIQRLQSLLDQGDWNSAIDSLRSLQDESGDRLVSVGSRESSFDRFLPLREVLHQILCTLPPSQQAALSIYRQRVEPLARSWFERAIQSRDELLLERLVREMFPSRWGDNAAMALGDLALERRDYDAACSYWRRIHRVPTWADPGMGDLDFAEERTDSKPNAIDPAKEMLSVYPDSEIAVADTHMRVVLASILSGSGIHAAREYERFCAVHPQAEGLLGGKRVRYADALGELLRQAARWPEFSRSEDWSTFAGNSMRNRIAPPIRDVAWEPIWRVSLDPPGSYQGRAVRHGGVPEVRVAESDQQLCSYYPVIVGSHVLLVSQHRLQCWELESGQPVSWAGNRDGQIYPTVFFDRAESEETTWRGLHVPRYTLTAEGSHIYFVLSADVVDSFQGASSDPAANRLVGIDLATQGRLLFPPVSPPGPGWYFDGAPLAHETNLYVCLNETAAVPAVHVGCLRAGKWRWIQRLGHGHRIAAESDVGRTHHLLTFAQDTVYVNTNLGAVVALSARDGTVQWVTRYPRSEWSPKDLRARPWYLLRDLTPCLWHEGHLVVAPMDYDGLFALDGTSGRLLWNTELPPGRLDITQLLGVVNGQLIASGRRLWWFDMATGEPSTVPPENPFPRELSSSRFGFGRGLLAGEQVLWPTRGRADQIFVFDVARGRVARQPLSLTAVDVSAGNLVVGQRHLLVAGPEQLAAFRIRDPHAGRRSLQ